MESHSTNPSDDGDADVGFTELMDDFDPGKQVADIAFAAELMRSGLVSERQLSASLANWSLLGSVTLSEYLLHRELVTPKQREQIDANVARKLSEYQHFSQRQSASGKNSSGQTRSAFEFLDPSGRVARLLGMRDALASVESNESREHTSQFQLIRKLGQGGLGTVWLARDMSMRRYVALKEIRNAEHASQAAVERFRREAEITGRLEHPGIVPIYQHGEDLESGQAFYTMRFLGKRTLQDAVIEYHERREDGEEDPMLLRHLLTSFVSVCQAVGHAHSKKVIHRDLKPENIAIDSFGQVIVIDWGLAKVLDEGLPDCQMADTQRASVDGVEHTVAGQVLGSPLYLAPEQAAGRVDEVDEATDVYGLGATLFAILTGQAPHEQSRDSSGSTTTRRLMSDVATGATPRARDVHSGVDPILEAICSKAMAKKRYARYTTPMALANDVERWMAGEPVEAFREPASQRLGRWIQNHRRISQLIGATIIVAFVAAITLGLAMRQSQLSSEQARLEEMRSDEREVEVQLKAAVHDLVGDVRFMSTLPPIQAIIDVSTGVNMEEDEETWTQRLETIYVGLLRANPDYLGVAYLGPAERDSIASEDEVTDERPLEISEIVRVERNASDRSYVRSVPSSRRVSMETSGFLQDVMNLEPGEVKMTYREQMGHVHNHHNGRLIAAVPVYDDNNGRVFGAVLIELDLTNRVTGVLDNLDGRASVIYLTDSQGILIASNNERSQFLIGVDHSNVSALVPEFETFITSPTRREFTTRSPMMLGKRIQLDETDPLTTVLILQQAHVPN